MRNRRARSRRYKFIGVASERRPESKHAYERFGCIWDEDPSWARRRTKDSSADLKWKAKRRSEVATRRGYL